MSSQRPDSKVNLDTNTQQATQGNECGVAGTTCLNHAVGSAGFFAEDNAEVDISENTQIAEQYNECLTTSSFPSYCENVGSTSYFAFAFGTSTVTGSALQQQFQSNDCTDFICLNDARSFETLVIDDKSNIKTDSSLKHIQHNKCDNTLMFQCENDGSDSISITSFFTGLGEVEMDSDIERSMYNQTTVVLQLGVLIMEVTHIY